MTNSGHETCLFPWGAGILAICNHDGPEKDTIQYSEDGLNFEVVSHVNLPPCAPGPFCADSYSNTEDGRGITWGLSHIATEETKSGNSYIIRFDCNLSKDVQRQGFRTTNIRMPESTYFSPDFDYDTKNKYSYDLEQLNHTRKKYVHVDLSREIQTQEYVKNVVMSSFFGVQIIVLEIILLCQTWL